MKSPVNDERVLSRRDKLNPDKDKILMPEADCNSIQDLLTYTQLLLNNGEKYLASLSACVTFETILPKVPRKDKSQYEVAIEKYIRDNHCDVETSYLLDDCRKVRNAIIHEHKYNSGEKLQKNLCILTGFDATSLVSGMDYEDLTRLRKKFSTDNKGEVPIYHHRYFDGFNDEHFRNLYEMRNKFCKLKGVLERALGNLKPAVYFDEISSPNSAYVWLAAVDDATEGRSKIERPSLSILATNQDFRIYIDFGGRCKQERLAYCDMLLSKRIDEYINRLDDQYKFFDIYWYYNIENESSIEDFITNRDNDILVPDEKYFDDDGIFGVTTITDRIKSYSEYIENNKTLTDSKFIIGKLYGKREIIKQGPNVVGTIFRVFRDLHPLYLAILNEAR